MNDAFDQIVVNCIFVLLPVALFAGLCLLLAFAIPDDGGYYGKRKR